jgi:LAS superfamily LD-carboxypeptidase LdcB
MDKITAKRVQELHPEIRNKVIDFFNEAERKGIILRITSGYRTYDEQNKLYAQGRTIAGSIVTNAKGGESNHNFALAFDVVQMINGKADWNCDWNAIAKIGKSFGFDWGGDWKTFKDKPHFEMNFGLTLAQLREKIKTGKIKDGYVILI